MNVRGLGTAWPRGAVIATLLTCATSAHVAMIGGTLGRCAPTKLAFCRCIVVAAGCPAPRRSLRACGQLRARCGPPQITAARDGHVETLALSAALAALLSVASCAFAVTPAGVAASGPAGAQVVGNEGFMVFDHFYRDPVHPLCQRRVQVEVLRHSWEEGNAEMVAHFSGTDVAGSGPADTNYGCSAEEIAEHGPLRQWALDATVESEDGTFDLGGRKGRWLQDGIEWEEGSRWSIVDARDLLPTQSTEEEEEARAVLNGNRRTRAPLSEAAASAADRFSDKLLQRRSLRR